MIQERFVYLLRAGENHYKIGIAQDVLARLKGVQNGNPMTLKVIATVYSEEAPKVELGLHRWLAEHKADGGREWFELSPTQALELVERMTELTISADVSRYLSLRNLIARQATLEKKFDELLNMEVVAKALAREQTRIADEAKAQMKKEAATVIDEDELLQEATKIVRILGRASASVLQRRLRVGYARAARLLDELEERGIVGAADGARARDVLV